ncbi:MAG: S41 family peptidase [Sphingomicrobium sp.]
MRIVPTVATAMIYALAAGLPAQILNAQSAAPAAVAQSPASPAAGPASAPFDKSEAAAAVSELAQKLEDTFVFPDIAKQYAGMLRANLAAGKYSSFADTGAFAAAVTDDLQAVHKDGHLNFRLLQPDATERRMRMRDDSSGVIRSGWLAKDVAYIDFKGFPGNDASIADLRKFLEEHRDAKTLIIDARHHRGGGLDEMNVLFPALFANETILLDMDTRAAVAHERGGPLEPEPFVRKIAAPAEIFREQHYVVPAKNQGALAKAKVYLLVSKGTGSAGEHLALALKRTRRATLIGERTHGAGNYGMFRQIGKGFVAFIPFGRTFDPDTGEGWEGVGVKPDLEIPPEQALDEALRLSGVKEKGEPALVSLR